MLNLLGIKRVQIISIFVALAFLLGSAACPICWAADPPAVSQGTERINLVVGKSVIMRSPRPIKRVSLASPEIAEFVLLSPDQIYLIGKVPGITNVTLWEDNKVTAIYDLEVSPDISRLKEKLHEILPDETDLRVIATHESIALSGTISSTANLSRTLALAKAYAPNNKVINLVQVGGVHQVMLEVKVAEVSRSLVKRLGFNFNIFGRDGLGVNLLGNLTQLEDLAGLAAAGAPFEIGVGPAVSALFQFQKWGVTATGFIDALKEDGLVKILAEPTLIALSGQTAEFLAGGEFPVPVPQGLGTVGIDYKTFGVGVNFTPTVLSNNKISIKVAPEASDLDFSTAVLLEGYAVPGITTRRASTVIELADGQSFAIAGLLRENIREIISKFPLLGSIPILGALFRSSSFQKNETELIIIVTPHLVKPLDLAKQSLPTDAFIEPNDVQFFLWGILQGRKKKKSSGHKPSLSYLDKKGGLEGEFGHTIP